LADESTRAQLELDPAVGTVEMKITARARDEDEVPEALDPNEAVEANERFVDFLSSRGFDTEGEQETKTRTALEYFTGKSLD
jgi:hypothetical protein